MAYLQHTHVGQHLFIGFTGTELTAETRRLLNTMQPGGVVLFARNIDTATELRALGRALRTEFSYRPLVAIDIDFAPVFDIELFDAKTDNALRERCWGRTADEVIRWAGAFLEGLEREGVAACPKHFPGLGGAMLDSHEKLPTIPRTREQLVAEDTVPYAKLMRRL